MNKFLKETFLSKNVGNKTEFITEYLNTLNLIKERRLASFINEFNVLCNRVASIEELTMFNYVRILTRDDYKQKVNVLEDCYGPKFISYVRHYVITKLRKLTYINKEMYFKTLTSIKNNTYNIENMDVKIINDLIASKLIVKQHNKLKLASKGYLYLKNFPLKIYSF